MGRSVLCSYVLVLCGVMCDCGCVIFCGCPCVMCIWVVDVIQRWCVFHIYISIYSWCVCVVVLVRAAFCYVVLHGVILCAGSFAYARFV